MSKDKKVKEVATDSVPTPAETQVVSGEQSAEPNVYVVVRDGFRVSEATYTDSTDDNALSELAFWRRVSDRSNDGTKVEIVLFDKKKHRTW